MASAEGKPLFIDSDVLVYANTKESPLHEVALSKIQHYGHSDCELWLSVQIMREFLAVRTRPQTWAEPASMSTLIERIRYFETHFSVAQESPLVLEKLLELVQEVPVGGKQIHDANIVATMLVHDVKHLLTNNQDDFKRFSKYITVIPLAAPASGAKSLPEG